MRYICYMSTKQREVVNQDGERFHIGPGRISGIAHVQGFVDEQRNCTTDMGLVRLTFSFATATGATYVYLSVLQLQAFWPAEPIAITTSAGAFKKEVTRTTIFDIYQMPRLRVSNSGEFKSVSRMCQVTMQLRCDESVMAVRMAVHAKEHAANINSGNQSVDFSLQYNNVLWRSAPKLTPSSVLPESEAFAMITRIGHLNDVGTPSELLPSPVVVV